MFSTLRAKVAAGFTVLVIINVVVSVWSIYNFNQLTETITTMIRQNYLNVIAAQNMLVSLERDNSAQLTMLNGMIDTGYNQFQDNRRNFFTWFNQARESNISQLGANTLVDISKSYANYTKATDTLKTILQTRGHIYAQNYHYNSIMPLFNQIKEGCFQLLDMNHNAMVETDAKANYISNRATLAVLGAALLAIVLSIVASWQFSQYILEPAEKLTDTVRKIGRGFLDVRADINSNDEIGELAGEFNRMAERLMKYEEINIEKLISEKKKSEAIVSTISDPIVVADKDGRIVLMNQLAEAVFDVSEDASIGKEFNQVIRNTTLNKYLSEYLQGKSPTNIPPYFELRVDGEDRYFRIKLNSSWDSSGKIMGVILILQDVTQFKELDKMKSEFMARVSHEFRTPLTSINMTFDILKDEHIGHVNKKQRELLIAAKQDAERLTKLVRELLELSRLESGKIQLKEDRVHTKSLVDFSIQPVLLQFKDKNVKLIANVDAEIPEFVADFQQLSWVVSNLVTNALRFTESGGNVTIDATTNGEDLIVSVRDTGCGIEPEELEKVFDRFVQLQDSPGSVGLGLSIAKEIVELYGGRIWVDSRVGVGTVFTFSLPIKKRVAPERKL
ncbi:MAG: ATP-binding protein [Bacteroidetes bacterium]|nr:ATP-binding protein [Bacteroidota bacterium]